MSLSGLSSNKHTDIECVECVELAVNQSKVPSGRKEQRLNCGLRGRHRVILFGKSCQNISTGKKLNLKLPRVTVV